MLIENNVGPILMIAYTNHALDHMLSSVINSGITSDVVRLGARSADDTIKQYSIEELERSSERSYYDRAMKSEFRNIKETEDQVMKLLKRVIGINVPSHVLLGHISMTHPEHAVRLDHPPSWISELQYMDDAFREDEWQDSTRKGKRDVQDSSIYAFWRSCKDLEFLQGAKVRSKSCSTPSASTNRFAQLRVVQESDEPRNDNLPIGREGETPINRHGDDSMSISSGRSTSDAHDHNSMLTDAEVFLQAHGISEIPEEPLSDRPLETLLDSNHCDVWSYSKEERARIDAHWIAQYRESEYDSQKQRFEDLVEKHSDLRQRQQSRDEAVSDIRSTTNQMINTSQIRLNIMRNRKLIGCTTTGMITSYAVAIADVYV